MTPEERLIFYSKTELPLQLEVVKSSSPLWLSNLSKELHLNAKHCLGNFPQPLTTSLPFEAKYLTTIRKGKSWFTIDMIIHLMSEVVLDHHYRYDKEFASQNVEDIEVPPFGFIHHDVGTLLEDATLRHQHHELSTNPSLEKELQGQRSIDGYQLW